MSTTTHFFKESMRDITSLGGFFFFILLILVTLILEKTNLFRDLILGFVITITVVILIRLFYFKNRPKRMDYKNWIEKLEASSFPSLHSARAIFLTLILIRFFNNNYLTIILILTAILVIYSRIYLKKHDWIDVVGGIILGIVTYLIIM